MPFNRPTLAEIISRASAEIESRLPGADARLRRNVLAVLNRVLAGASHGLHGHLDWIAKQILPQTAEDEYLQRLAAIWSITPRPAVAAGGEITFTGTLGAIIEAGTSLQRSDGVEFSTLAEATLAAASVTVAVEAVDPGVMANTLTGSQLFLVNPLEGVNPAALVGAAGLTGGSDIESSASLLQRLLDRVSQPPAGGNRYDYVTWATSLPGVDRAWVLPLAQGVGTLDLLILADLESTGSIVASDELCAAVRAAIVDLAPNDVKYLRVRPPVMTPLDFTLTVTPDTAAVRAEVLAELTDLLDRFAAPGLPLPLSKINEAISLAAGETDHILTLPAANVTPAADSFPIMGAVTWL